VIYFWQEPQKPLTEMFHVLKPGGALVLGFRSGSDGHARNFPSTIYRFYESDEVQSMLAACGFQSAAVDPCSDGTQFVVAKRPAAS
jgi:hypothetical protein